MKINISINKFRLAGGMERYLFDILDIMLQDGHDFSVYASKFDRGAPHINEIDAHKIAIKWLPKSLRVPYFSARWQKSLGNGGISMTLNLSQNADLLICGGTHRGYCAVLSSAPSFYDRAYIRSGQKAYNSAGIIIAHSKLMARELTELYGIPEAKIRVIYPPANTERFTPKGEAVDFRKQFGIAESDTIFLFPSTGHKRKGLPLLQKVFAATNLPVKLIVAGAPVHTHSRNVIAYGFGSSMDALYRGADFTIMASLYEPFGLVGIESLLCGTRTVMADNIGCTELYSPEAGFIFNRSDEASLHQALAEAAALKNAGTHRIANPMSAFIDYEPSVRAHVDKLYPLLSV